MTLQDADIAQLRSELEAFIHIIEALAECRKRGHVTIKPDEVQRLARVLNLHVASAVTKLYGPQQ